MLDQTNNYYGSKGLYIGGQWVQPTSGKTFPVFNPATGEAYATAPDGTKEDVQKAIDAAHAAQPAWAALKFTERAKILHKIAEGFEARREEFIQALTAECGGWIKKSMFEIGYVPEIFRAAAADAYSVVGELMPSDHHKVSIVERTPLGVVSVVSPWNVPALLSCRGMGVALAVGNTIVLKPSEETPLTGGLMIAEVFEEAGVPEGVLNVVTCSRDNVPEVGDEMVVNEKVKAISFTGSSAVGKQIAAKAGGLLKKACVELGGKDSMLILDDADLDLAVEKARFSSFFYQGQICMSAEKLVVDKSVAEEFTRKLVEATAQLKVGDPTSLDVHLGPMINERQAAKVEAILADAVSKGAKVEVGGTRDGVFFQPTVLTGVNESMEIFHEEAFGPIASVIVADDEDDAISIANNCKYGLSSAVITENEDRGLRVARRLETGMCHINDATVYDEPTIPFGGVKNSGMGRHGGRWSVEAFTQTRWLTIERGGRKTPF